MKIALVTSEQAGYMLCVDLWPESQEERQALALIRNQLKPSPLEAPEPAISEVAGVRLGLYMSFFSDCMYLGNPAERSSNNKT